MQIMKHRPFIYITNSMLCKNMSSCVILLKQLLPSLAMLYKARVKLESFTFDHQKI